MSTKKTKSNKFLNIPRNWVYLIGYKYPAINRYGKPKLNKNKEQIIKAIDYVDLLLIDEIRGFSERGNKECFEEAVALSQAVGMIGQEKQLCDRVLQLCGLGFVNASKKTDDGKMVPKVVFKVDTEFVNDAAEARKEWILEQQRMDSQTMKLGDILAKTHMLQEYLQEYIQEQLQEQLPEYLPEQLPEQLPEHLQKPLQEDSQDDLSEYLPEYSQEDLQDQLHKELPEPLQEPLPEHLQESPQKPPQGEVYLGEKGRKDIVSKSWLQDKGIVSVKDIFENAINPLRDRGWTWDDINDVVEAITGKVQQIKEIPREQRPLIYNQLMKYLEYGGETSLEEVQRFNREFSKRWGWTARDIIEFVGVSKFTELTAAELDTIYIKLKRKNKELEEQRKIIEENGQRANPEVDQAKSNLGGAVEEEQRTEASLAGLSGLYSYDLKKVDRDDALPF